MKVEKAFSSIYFPSDKQHLVKELIELKWKERTSVNNIILHAIEEYCKIHGDGNPNFTITQFADENFKACPAFFRPNSTWVDYLLTIKNDKQQSKEFDEQLNMILSTWNRVSSGKIRRNA